MKHILFILSLMALWPSTGFGQTQSVESARVAFLSQKISITPVQAEKFWPLYNEFQDKRTTNRKTIRKLYKTMDEIPDLTLEKIKQQINLIATLKSEEIVSEKEFYHRCLLIITPKQLADLMSAEREFQKILIKKVSED